MANSIDPSPLLTPYARSMGVEVQDDGAENGTAPILSVPFSDTVQGRPSHYHGGAISGLLETAGYAAIRTQLELDQRGNVRLKPINITMQFLAAAKSETLFAQARITKLGRRNANVEVECWQADRSRPRATAVMNVLMVTAGPE
ncbi:PaaI family thioesterase [Qipengyuania sp. DSG2-2]|uniref:PaaI family thioesterase n=1 Tax=Qipengyuania sp. DGS2-2 TaxID=3349631 RepID=UPI0036D2D696